MADTLISLKIPGQQLADAPMPQFLRAGMRTTDTVDPGPFLPAGLVRVQQAFDLSQRSRDAVGNQENVLQCQPEQVVVLELPENLTLITTVGNLQATLQRVAPQAWQDGAWRMEALHDRATATRGLLSDLAGGLIARVFTLELGTDRIIDEAKNRALEWAREWFGDAAQDTLQKYAALGVSWLGTKALMWAIEKQLQGEPGLYRWAGSTGEPTDLLLAGDVQLAREAQEGPLLIFIHGTASNTVGSFGAFQAVPADWKVLTAKFGDRIYAFEHRTLSESPIDNALALAKTLPKGARINLVTHSRGGLVGDFVCLGDFDDTLIDAFQRHHGIGGASTPEQRDALDPQLDQAHQEHRRKLRELRGVLRDRGLHIERYVRVACPARGTRLASSNFDVFLSGLLSLIGLVPYLAGNPIYAAFKRVVLEIARHRTNPGLVPGIEAMLPESPTGRFLATVPPKPGMQLAVIAGDIEGGSLFKRLGVLFTDVAFFQMADNDLVVDTDSMYAGLARPEQAHFLFEQGAQVSHFNYFANQSSRLALRQWLTASDALAEDIFQPLPTLLQERDSTLATDRQADRAFSRSRRGDEAAANLPVVLVLPGIMGSHLWRAAQQDRIWFDPLDMATGGLAKIRMHTSDVAAEKLFDMFYGDLCRSLRATHQVERFPYDWRLSLADTAKQFASKLRAVLDHTKTSGQPIRILAHSMGGLVVRACIAHDPALWNEVMQRPGARLIMLGTPNQGSHLMVETLLGKSDTIRKLAQLDFRHSLQEVLDIVAEFPGALQLLPRSGFTDTGGAQAANYYDPDVWTQWKRQNRDFWFGDGIAGQPTREALTSGRWLWEQDASLPGQYQQNVLYIYGQAELTPCGVREENGRLRMLGTAAGDGTVTWDSGTIAGIGSFYTMPVEHGALTDTEEYFPALEELLSMGQTQRLRQGRPQLRAVGAAQPFAYDAGPVPYPSAEEVARSLLGARSRQRVRARPAPVLHISCTAMDLRFVNKPVMVGHYARDVISGAEALIDRELVDRELSMRYHLGLYAGAPGTATVVLLAQTDAERQRQHSRGAVVIGLGQYGELTPAGLTQAVQVGTLRYLMQLVDNRSGEDQGPIEASLASLLLGYNSTTNISIEDSVTALVHGVLAANQQFTELKQFQVRVTTLEIIELYLDTAIATTKALLRVAERLHANTARSGRRIEVAPELRQEQGWRQRLDMVQGPDYWPRLVVTDADRGDDTEAFRDGPALAITAEGRLAIGAAAGARAERLAQCLRFAYLGQRARSETEIQQRQPGLAEALVKKSITSRAFSTDFARTLFQLLVPYAFKDAARQLENIVLVLDSYTANFPWELMMVDDKPFAVQTAIVRQLQSPRYRARVRQTAEMLAYVIGNPATDGFYTVFAGQAAGGPNTLEALPGAEQEARTVQALLKQNHYDVVEAIGTDQSMLDVINKLYRRPYRIIHIAAHGVYAQQTITGSTRTGVVLSDGMLITAAEIDAMEVVPDLVFLNCCHLATTSSATELNKLAYSVARELIEMGVRAVVAAGWAVDDQAANLFAEVFYTELFNNLPFGEAVFAARRRTYEKFPGSNTWGAYQAYGDPGFVMNPQRDPSTLGSVSPPTFVAPEELISGLEQLQAEVAVKQLTRQQRRELEARVERLGKACPQGSLWQQRPQVCFALAQTYVALGSTSAPACQVYRQAIACNKAQQQELIHTIAQLINSAVGAEEEHGAVSCLRSELQRLGEPMQLPDACRMPSATEPSEDAGGTAVPQVAASETPATPRAAAKRKQSKRKSS